MPFFLLSTTIFLMIDKQILMGTFLNTIALESDINPQNLFVDSFSESRRNSNSSILLALNEQLLNN